MRRMSSPANPRAIQRPHPGGKPWPRPPCRATIPRISIGRLTRVHPSRKIFIGDLQGCCEPFERLLKRLDFDPAADQLCLAGDLVNRGGESLAALARVFELGGAHFTVLGNHDLHLLAYAHRHSDVGERNREFEKILEDPRAGDMLDWLRRQPLLRTWPEERLALVHAGIDPRWDRRQAAACARELEAVLAGPECGDFLDRMYGDSPRRWNPEHSRWDRLRAITNVFTRMRFVDEQGRLALTCKGGLENAPAGYRPWFELLHPDWQDWTICFGHWSLLGYYETDRIIGLDSGCVWGGQLTALVVEGNKRRIVQVECT